jgi:hypothetical protein
MLCNPLVDDVMLTVVDWHVGIILGQDGRHEQAPPSAPHVVRMTENMYQPTIESKSGWNNIIDQLVILHTTI